MGVGEVQLAIIVELLPKGDILLSRAFTVLLAFDGGYVVAGIL